MIQLKNVTKSFGKIKALDDITFDFPEGKIIGLFGPNGAGKSTTMKLIVGLMRPDKGEVSINGNLPQDMKKDIAYLPEINHLISWWTVRDAVDFMKTFYTDWNEERYQELKDFLNIRDDMKLSKISKGQLAKVKLLLTLSRRAPYLLLDEPFSGIDLVTREEIINALIKEYTEGNQTIIISTHEIDEIEHLVEYVICMKNGRFTLTGIADELRAQKGMSLTDIMKEAFRNEQ